MVLLEQVQRWRGERRRRLSEQRIRFLEELNTGIVSAMPAGLVVVDAGGLRVLEQLVKGAPTGGGGSGKASKPPKVGRPKKAPDLWRPHEWVPADSAKASRT